MYLSFKLSKSILSFGFSSSSFKSCADLTLLFDPERLNESLRFCGLKIGAVWKTVFVLKESKHHQGPKLHQTLIFQESDIWTKIILEYNPDTDKDKTQETLHVWQ